MECRKFMLKCCAGYREEAAEPESRQLLALDKKLDIEDKEVHLAMTKRDFKMSHSTTRQDLPESIYGAAMMAMIRSSQTYRSVVHGVTACVFGALVLNIFAQFYVLICTKMYICDAAVIRVRQLYGHYEAMVFPGGEFSPDGWHNFDRTEEVCQIPMSQPAFFIAILAIWTGTCWVDLLDSLTSLSSWIGLPSGPAGERTVVEESEEHDCVILTHADSVTKSSVIVFILLPKLLIAMSCWWLGARWLLSTTCFQDLLLNAVALAFVTELDELLYFALIPDEIKESVQSTKIAIPPKLEKSGAATSQYQADLLTFVAYRDRRLKLMMGRMASTTMVVVGLPIVYTRYLQQVLPGYKWDVHANCEGYIREMTQGM